MHHRTLAHGPEMVGRIDRLRTRSPAQSISNPGPWTNAPPCPDPVNILWSRNTQTITLLPTRGDFTESEVEDRLLAGRHPAPKSVLLWAGASISNSAIHGAMGSSDWRRGIFMVGKLQSRFSGRPQAVGNGAIAQSQPELVFQSGIVHLP